MASIFTLPPEKRICPTELRVSSRSEPASVAGAIAHRLREYDVVRLRAIGASASHQALKAVALARSFLAEEGKDLVITPTFRQELVEGAERIVLEFTVYRVEQGFDADMPHVPNGVPGGRPGPGHAKGLSG